MGTGQNCTKTTLYQGSILHDLHFCTEGHFCTRVKKNIYINTKIKIKDKLIKKQDEKKKLLTEGKG